MVQIRETVENASWQKVAHNIILVGSAVTALVVGGRVVGRYHIDQEKLRLIERNITALADNVRLISERLDAAEARIDRTEPTIFNNQEEINILREDNRGRYRIKR